MVDENEVPDEYIYDADPAEMRIKLRFKNSTTLRELIIRDMEGTARDAYLDTVKNRTKVEDGKAVGFKTFDGHQTDLISRMLYEATPANPEGRLVPLSEIKAWPGALQSKLVKQCRLIAGLDDKAEDKAKNDSAEKS